MKGKKQEKVVRRVYDVAADILSLCGNRQAMTPAALYRNCLEVQNTRNVT
jgi:hypothetical protein